MATQPPMTSESWRICPRGASGNMFLDISLAKSFEVRNGQRLQFRWEAFNALNTVNWGNPNGTLGNSNFGVISSALAAREMQISLKYLF